MVRPKARRSSISTDNKRGNNNNSHNHNGSSSSNRGTSGSTRSLELASDMEDVQRMFTNMAEAEEAPESPLPPSQTLHVPFRSGKQRNVSSSSTDPTSASMASSKGDVSIDIGRHARNAAAVVGQEQAVPHNHFPEGSSNPTLRDFIESSTPEGVSSFLHRNLIRGGASVSSAPTRGSTSLGPSLATSTEPSGYYSCRDLAEDSDDSSSEGTLTACEQGEHLRNSYKKPRISEKVTPSSLRLDEELIRRELGLHDPPPPLTPRLSPQSPRTVVSMQKSKAPKAVESSSRMMGYQNATATMSTASTQPINNTRQNVPPSPTPAPREQFSPPKRDPSEGSQMTASDYGTRSNSSLVDNPPTSPGGGGGRFANRGGASLPTHHHRQRPHGRFSEESDGWNLHSIPLVKMSLRNITYAPVIRSYKSPDQGRRRRESRSSDGGSGHGGGGSSHGNGGSSSSGAGGAGSGDDGTVQSRTPSIRVRSMNFCGRFCLPTRHRAVRLQRKVILHNVTVDIEPGELAAWMGPSGSGKTSLTKVAAGLIKNPKRDLVGQSSMFVNNDLGLVPKRLFGIVWQDDLLLSNLTVRESVAFAARLKTPAFVPVDRLGALIDQVIKELGLERIKHSMIGSIGSVGGISGGERKRVAVAAELVARPSVLLLDEPTSGLDATTALSLMKLLKRLTSLGHSVVTVVHQPRTTIFEMFDSLLLLSKGRVVFAGIPANARMCLESHPTVTPLPPETGIADWIMDTIMADEVRPGGCVLPTHWKSNEARERRNSIDLRSAYSQIRRHSTLAELNSGSKFTVRFFTQLRLLIWRCLKQQRGEKLTKVAGLTTFTYTFFTGLFWWQLQDDTSRIYERTSLLFFIIIAQSNRIVTESIAVFQRERVLFNRERAKNMYGVLPYFIASTLSEMTNSVVLPCVYGGIVYWVAGLRPTLGHFMTFMLILYLTVSAAQATGLFLSIAIRNMAVSLMLAPLITLLLMILGGFYIPINNMNQAVQWASWFSMARYGFSAFVINEFEGRDIACVTEGSESNTISYGPEGLCPLPGDVVIQDLGIDGLTADIWVNVFFLVGMQVILRVSSYALLRWS